MKWLVGKVNSPWGIKKDGQGNQFYTHIIDFATTELRDEYLNENVFFGDYKELVKQQPEKGNHPRTANQIRFRVDNNKEYTTDTVDSLLNKDFAVSYDEKNDYYSFWAIEGRTEGSTTGIIEYVATRDWLFEKGINNMFKTSDTVINRAHINDVKDGLWNIAQDSENSTVEEIEQFDDNNFTNVITNKNILDVDYQSKFKGDDYTKFKAELRKGWTAYYFAPAVASVNGSPHCHIIDCFQEPWYLGGPAGDEGKAIQAKLNSYMKYESQFVPLFCMVIPNSEDIIGDTRTMISNETLFTNAEFRTLFNSSPQLVKAVPLPYSPISVDSIETIVFNDKFKKYEVQFYDHYSSELEFNNTHAEYGIGTRREDGKTARRYLGMVKGIILPNEIKTEISKVNDASTYDNDPTKPFILNNIAKLHKYPYKQIYLKSITGARMNLYQQIVKNSYQWNVSFTYAPDVWHQIIRVKDIDDPSGLYNSDFTYGIRLDDISTFSIPNESNPYNEFLNRNQDQINFQSRRLTFNAFLGAMGSAAGLGTAIGGTISTGAGASLLLGNILGSIGQITNSIFDIQQQKAMLNDLKRNPSQVNGNGGDTIGVLVNSDIQPLQFTDELWPELKASVGQHFHMYGSKLNARFRNFNSYINTKYHFNFIQCESMFENYKEDVPMTNETRQLIDKSLASGLTIWHFRDKKTFKGIKNYNVNNVDYVQTKL